MVTTVAPTMPVLAASSAPTTQTEIARPPRMVPNRRDIDSSRSSATLDFSSITPMKTNSGTASIVWLFMMRKMRFGSACR